jgi:hypothetical protein
MRAVDEASQAQVILKPKVIKLGSATVISLEKHEGGKLKFSGQLKAANQEELDLVCKKLTRSVLNEKTLQSDSKVSEVTHDEVKSGSNRKETIGRWALGFGPTWVSNVNSGGGKFGLLIGYTWEIIDPNVMIKLYWDGAAGFSFFAIGANYFFSESKISPFAGLSFGYAGSSVQSVPGYISGVIDTSGFAGGAELGMSFFRNSRVNLNVSGVFNTLFTSNYLGTPSLVGLRIGVLF